MKHPLDKKTRMKNSISALFILISFNVFAQNTDAGVYKEKQYIPLEGYAGVSMNITGLINNLGVSAAIDPIGTDVLLGKYYATDKWVFRAGLGINSISYKGNSTDSVGSTQINMDSTYSQTALYISPGFEYHFLDDKRLDPYIGGALSMGFISKPKYSTTISIIDTTGEDKTDIDYQSEGGFVFGATTIVGFNYYIAINFALGAEYHLGFYNKREGGDWERVTVNTPVSGTSTSVRTFGAARTSTTTVGLSQQLNITLSYFFNIKG